MTIIPGSGKCRSAQGFSLITVAVVLTVASLALVAMLPSSQTTLKANSATQTKLTTILTSLRDYEATNGTLPCPADATQPIGSTAYGVMAANGGPNNNCTGGTPAASYVDTSTNTAAGMVPVKSLGLSNDYAVDSFGRDITYAVDTNATAACWASNPLPGTLLMADNGTTNNAVAALISHGKDGHGAWIPMTNSSGTVSRLNAYSQDTDQLINAHVDVNFNPTTSAQQTDAAGNIVSFVKKSPTQTFDDLLVYKSPLWSLNKLPTSQGSTNYAVMSTYPANGTYYYDQTLTFVLTYPTAVTVTGSPRLDLNALMPNTTMPSYDLGKTGNVNYATYTSGSGTTQLTFTYTVGAYDYAMKGIAVTAPVDLNGGTIAAVAPNILISNCFIAPNLSQVLISNQCLYNCVYESDEFSERIRLINPLTNILISYAGCGGSNGIQSGVAAASANLYYPARSASDTNGNLYFADQYNNVVREVVASTGIINTVAGNGTQGYTGDGGPATAAELYFPGGVAVDGAGNIYIADEYNSRIRVVNATSNVITTYAGNGIAGYAGDGGPATAAQLSHPLGVALDPVGNLYVADLNRVRKITATTGIITTVAGNGSADSGDGGPATSAGVQPTDVKLDAYGNIYTADYYGNRVRIITAATGIINAYAGNGTSGYSGDNGTATSAELNGPSAISIDVFGNIYIADLQNQRVRLVNPAGIITTYAGNGSTQNMVCSNVGNGGPPTSAWLDNPNGIAITPPRRIYLTAGTTSWTVPADWDNNENKIEVLGAGGSGIVDNSVAGGGGGGGYASITNFPATAGAIISVTVGAGGTGVSTVFNGALIANAGGNGSSSAGGAGGSASGGTVNYSGGAGGGPYKGSAVAGGGGGAAGPLGGGGSGASGCGGKGAGESNGGGSNGGASASMNSPAGGTNFWGTGGGIVPGGPGTLGGGGGGAASGLTGGNGSIDMTWDSAHGVGSGGGGGCPQKGGAENGGPGGIYGGGGGGGYPTGGAGGSGLIVISYTPMVPASR